MYRLLAMVLSLFVCANSVLAQERLSIFADQFGEECNADIVAPGIASFFVIQKSAEETSALQFRIRGADGFNGTLIGQTNEYSTTPGAAESGVATTFGDCLTGDRVIMKLIYVFFDSPPPCSFLEVVGDTATSGLIALDCSAYPQSREILGGRLYFNGGGVSRRGTKPTPCRKHHYHHPEIGTPVHTEQKSANDKGYGNLNRGEHHAAVPLAGDHFGLRYWRGREAS